MSERPDRSLLKDVFPPRVVPAEAVEGIYPEVQDYKRHFGGLDWTEVKRKHYECATDAFTLMDHRTLKDYIGGFLDIVLSDPDSLPCEFLIYFAGRQSFVAFCKILSEEQADFLIATIDWLIEDDYYSDHDRQQYEHSRSEVKAV